MQQKSKTLSIFMLIFMGIIIYLPKGTGQYALLHYDFSFPLANTKDYTENPSFRGGSIEYGLTINDKLSAGLKIGWHIFYDEKEKTTYVENNTTIYGKQFRWINSFPILATSKYQMGDPGKRFQPYFGFSAGTYAFNRKTDLGLYTFLDEFTWHIGLLPEIGVLIPITPEMNININARYNKLMGNARLATQDYLSFGAGIMLH